MSTDIGLQGFKKARHYKTFRNIFKRMRKDMAAAGIHDLEVEITRVDTGRSRLRRFFDPGFGETEEIMEIFAEKEGCQIEILIPMGKGGIAPPYLMEVRIPVPMDGTAEYSKGSFGFKWHLDPDSKVRKADLKNTMPKVNTRQSSISKKMPVQGIWKIPTPHSLASVDEGNTSWVIHAGYEGGAFSGGSRPRVRKFIEAIPKVADMLGKWQDQGV